MHAKDKKRALVVSGNTGVRESVKKELIKKGFRVTLCPSPETAEKDLRTLSVPISLVVTDLTFELITGIESKTVIAIMKGMYLVRMIHNQWGSTKTILMVSQKEYETHKNILETCGVNACWIKSSQDAKIQTDSLGIVVETIFRTTVAPLVDD